MMRKPPNLNNIASIEYPKKPRKRQSDGRPMTFALVTMMAPVQLGPNLQCAPCLIKSGTFGN